jgi:UDP-3-O-[3-hydroxymyristoyl] N-acetylglucosamine deacetylase
MSGVGLHGNKPCAVNVLPAGDGGLRFLHRPSGTMIPATADYVGDLSLATTLVKDGVRLQTVEHILSALFGLGIDHALIEVDGEELPILDGSSAPWAKAIAQAGTRNVKAPKKRLKVLKPVQVQNGNRWMRVSPFNELRIDCAIDFPTASIGSQSLALTITPDRYRREIAPARTFCLKCEIDYMHSNGLALGGNLDNAVVYDDNGYLNDDLRFENEAVRHKMLDLLGDLALAGAPISGLVEAHAAGHALHVALVKKLISEPDAWTMVETAQASTHRLFQTEFKQRLAAV